MCSPRFNTGQSELDTRIFIKKRRGGSRAWPVWGGRVVGRIGMMELPRPNQRPIAEAGSENRMGSGLIGKAALAGLVAAQELAESLGDVTLEGVGALSSQGRQLGRTLVEAVQVLLARLSVEKP